MKPILDHILLEKIEEEIKSGLITPDALQDKKLEGKGRVIAVGHGIRNNTGKLIPLIVKEGDIVLFTRYKPVVEDGKEYYLTREDHILAILNEKTESK